MSKNSISFEKEVEKLPVLLKECPASMYADFTKIETFCSEVSKDKSIKTKLKERVLTEICSTMVILVEEFEDYRTQRKAFEIFQIIVMKFVSLQHFENLIPIIKKMLSDEKNIVYRRRCITILTNTVKKLDDTNLFENFTKEMLGIAKRERQKLLIMDFMDFLCKTCGKISNDKLLMDIFWFISRFLDADEAYQLAARRAFPIMWNSVKDKPIVYHGISILAKKDVSQQNICMLVELILKGLKSEIPEVALKAFNCLRSFKGIKLL